MSGISGIDNDGGRSARDDAVLFEQQYVWPGDLTEIPDWV